MSAAPVSGHDFVGGRGRGYRPEQVDRFVAALSAQRNAALDELSRLTRLAEELAAESARLAEQVAGLAPQTYQELSERARSILALTEEEVAESGAAAQETAQALLDAAETAGRETRDAARAYAEKVRAQAGEDAERILAEARQSAAQTLAAAGEDAARTRAEGEELMAQTRARTSSVLTHQEQEHAERHKRSEAELLAHETEVTTRHDELMGRAEAVLAAAWRGRTEAEEAARHRQEDAGDRAAELFAEARVREERVVRETERILREHQEAREELHARMAHVRNSLAALTGRTGTRPSQEG
ncbi:cellulose-binding protein [Streptomyces sp. NBC_00102]|uniref:cellulose-binding protein n=1 Tax=Streptomyces sp. NBC_00102 TaxID=2975652 RepID=UPI0022548286|nr:cellulose-binding protein [Streptomyces sp. NBC_00102]MCX5399121.1 DivIVA domain-containing protein [Streptomyces sp. NBC_00102]